MARRKSSSEADINRQHWERVEDEGRRERFLTFCKSQGFEPSEAAAVGYAESRASERGKRSIRAFAEFLFPGDYTKFW